MQLRFDLRRTKKIAQPIETERYFLIFLNISEGFESPTSSNQSRNKFVNLTPTLVG